MVNVFRILKPMVKLVGISPQKVEIEPGRSSLMAFSRGFFKFWPWPSNPTLTSLISFSSANSATDKSDRSTAFQAERVVKGLKKLGGVESCTVVGFSYGGVVAFKMAKLYPGFVDSVVVTGSIVEFTRSKSDKLLNGVGFSLWSDFLSPETVEDLKGLIKVGSHGKLFSSLPHLFYRDILQEMYPFRNERAQVLDELVLPDHYEVPSTAYTQMIHLLWGENEKIFDLSVANETILELGDRASLKLIKNAGHIDLMERPCCYNKNLKEILRSIQAK